MEYKELGKTRERISTIGMGTWAMAVHGQSRAEQEKQALRLGVELGMNLIDTAEMYGDGNAERLVGDAIRGIRDSVFIASKVSPGHLHYDDVLAACNRSLERLGTDRIDLYQVHWPNSRIPITETMKAMQKLVEDGKVRYVGVSNFSVEETKAAQEALGDIPLASNQVEYSLTVRDVEPHLLPYCQDHRITLIAYRPLAYGRIPKQIPKELLLKRHMSEAQLMLVWVTHPKGVVAIPKSSTVEHTEQNAAAASFKLSENEYDQISTAFS